MVCVGLGTDDSIAAARRLVQKFTESSASGDATVSNSTTYARTVHLGVPICKALLAFLSEDWTSAASALIGVNEKLGVIGGSHAQRDVFWQIYLTAIDKLKSQAVERRRAFRTGKLFICE